MLFDTKWFRGKVSTRLARTGPFEAVRKHFNLKTIERWWLDRLLHSLRHPTVYNICLLKHYFVLLGFSKLREKEIDTIRDGWAKGHYSNARFARRRIRTLALPRKRNEGSNAAHKTCWIIFSEFRMDFDISVWKMASLSGVEQKFLPMTVKTIFLRPTGNAPRSESKVLMKRCWLEALNNFCWI